MLSILTLSQTNPGFHVSGTRASQNGAYTPKGAGQ